MTAIAASGLQIRRADYRDPAHAEALVALLDAYARDKAGGGHPLSEFAKTHLVAELAARPQAFSVLAFDGAGRPLADRLVIVSDTSAGVTVYRGAANVGTYACGAQCTRIAPDADVGVP